MRLKINKNSIEIPTADNLTCRQYLECLKANENEFFILKYISVVSGLSYSEVANSSISFITIQRINNYVQQLKQFDYFLINQSAQILIKGDLFVSTRKDFDVEKVGVRILFEAKAAQTESREELAIYLLAILLTPSFDYKEVAERYEQLLEENYIKILSFAAFFLSNYLKTSKNERKSLIMRVLAWIKNIIQK